MKMNYFVIFALSAAATALPLKAIATENLPPIDTLVAALAEKPAQHAAVAAYYRQKSGEAQRNLERHQAMKKAYAVPHPKSAYSGSGMQVHCDKMIKTYASKMKEYEQMAVEQDTLGH